MRIKAFITGCKGTILSAEEKQFIRGHNPWGFIVFARNIENPEQLHALTSEFRSLVGRDNAPVLVDQEGGRVRRMRPPHWPDYGTGQALGKLYETDQENGLRACWLQSRLMAHDLISCGINVDCLPVLDVPVPGANDVIGDRAYSHNPAVITEMGRVACEGLFAGGVLPVIKHIPGHGRAEVDSHYKLPVVETDLETLKSTDFQPFRMLSDMPLAMTAHVIYSAIDGDDPATTSHRVIDEIIRSDIGFDGLLMSDDLSMQALSGDYAERTKRAFAAGCDVVLHCNGEREEMEPIADACPVLEGKGLVRAQAAEALLSTPQSDDLEALRNEYDQLTGFGVA